MSTGYEWITDQFTITSPLTAYTMYTEPSVRRYDAPTGKKVMGSLVRTDPVPNPYGYSRFTPELVDEGDAVEGTAEAYTGFIGAPDERPSQEYTITVTLICIDA